MISLVAGLAVGGVVWSQQAKTVQQDRPGAILGAATTALELNHRIRGTYAGVTFSEVKVARAGAKANPRPASPAEIAELYRSIY